MKIKSKAKKQEDFDKHLNELLDIVVDLSNKDIFLRAETMVKMMKKDDLTDEEIINIAVPTPLGREIIKYLLKEAKNES